MRLAARFAFATRTVLPALVLVALLGETASAQDGTWDVEKGMVDPARAAGGYFSLLKLGLVWLTFAAFVYLADWVNQDVQRLKLGFAKWNSIVVFTFLSAFVLHWMLPWSWSFWVSWPVMLLALSGPVLAYAKTRNAAVTEEDRVLTSNHVRSWAAPLLKKVGIKIAAGSGPVEIPLELHCQGGANEGENRAKGVMLAQQQGFNPARQLLLDALNKRAGGLLLDYTQQAVTVKFQIDGVFYDAPGVDRVKGDNLLAILKSACNLNPKERVQRQQGTFEVRHEKQKYTCKFTSQGTQTGERVLIVFDDNYAAKAKLETIGLRQKPIEDLKKLLGEKAGLVLVATPAGRGLSSLLNATALGVDRFMRSAVGIESVKNRDLKVENVPITTYDPDKGESPNTVLPGVIRQYPDVYIIPDFVNGETLNILCQEVIDEQRLVVGAIHAKEASEALLRALMLKVPVKNFVTAVAGVVSGRLVRKLCEQCREAYTPPPNVIQQLRLPADKVGQFYRPPQPKQLQPGEKPQPPCSHCNGLGYHGRTGVYELLIVNNDVRQALAKQPTVESVRQAAQKAGMATLQEEAIALVVRGVTSLEEIMRALKE